MLLVADTFLDCLLVLLADQSEMTRSVVKRIMTIRDEDHKRQDLKSSDDTLKDFYYRLVKEALANKCCQDNPDSMKLLLLKVKSDPIRDENPSVISLLTDILSNDSKIDVKDFTRYMNHLRNLIALNTIEVSLRKAYGKFQNIVPGQDNDDLSRNMNEIVEMFNTTVKDVEKSFSDAAATKGENYICLSDRDSIKRAVETFHARSVAGIIRTGLIGLNIMLGKRGGLALGEYAVFAARSHNYKTGMLVSLMLWCVIYNTHILPPDGKKWLVYFVSLENETYQNLIDVFKTLYARTMRSNPDNLSSEEIIDWLYQYFNKYNIELVIDKYEPHEYSFKKHVSKVAHFEEQGYVLLAHILDYMSEARGIDAGDTFSSVGKMYLIGENYVKFRAFGSTRGYMSATGHQLIKEADRVATTTRLAVKKFNPSMFSWSPDVFRTVDVVVYLNIEQNIDNVSFLTMQLRKNRNCKDTSEAYKFCAYPFTPFGIIEDLNGSPGYVKDIDEYGGDKAVGENQINQASLF